MFVVRLIFLFNVFFCIESFKIQEILENYPSTSYDLHVPSDLRNSQKGKHVVGIAGGGVCILQELLSHSEGLHGGLYRQGRHALG